MMFIAYHDHQRDVLSRISIDNNDVLRYGSVNRTNAFSSSNSAVLINSSVQSSYSLLFRTYLTVMNVSSCEQLSILHICPVSFSSDQTYRHHSVQVPVPSHLTQPSSDASCSSNMIPSTSHLSEPCRSIQLFIKSIRNTTISIHIDSTSFISDLKHLIYAHDGIPPCDQRLMHRGRELRDDALLSGLSVDGDTITCLLRVFGGNPRTHKLPIHWWFGFSRG